MINYQKASNISIKTMLELRTKFGNFGNFGHISDGLRKQYSVRTQCCNLIGSEPLYIPCIGSTGSDFKPHQCLLAGMWKRLAQLPCWPPRGQQVLHQR